MTLIVRDVTVVHPSGTVAGQDIEVDGDRITSVGPTTGPVGGGTDPATTVLDGRGRFAIAGMATCHFHSTYHQLGTRMTPLGAEEAPAYQALRAARNARLALERGFTSAISAGAASDIDASLVKAIDDGLIAGPRLVPGSRELSTTGHSNDNVPWQWEAGPAPGIRICNGAEEFRRGVRDEVKRGARIIKVFLTGGHGTTSPAERLELTADELEAAIEAAHARGALIRAHIANKEALLLAVSLGIDIVDHGDGIDDECRERLLEAGTFVVPSQYFPHRLIEAMGDRLGFGAAMQGDLDAALAELRATEEAGIPLLLGDDYGAVGLPHGDYGHEASFYVERAGISPASVLRWATENGARAAGRGHELGSLEVGKLADLVLLDRDPLLDPGVLADHAHLTVVKGGCVVVPAPA